MESVSQTTQFMLLLNIYNSKHPQRPRCGPLLKGQEKSQIMKSNTHPSIFNTLGTSSSGFLLTTVCISGEGQTNLNTN